MNSQSLSIALPEGAQRSSRSQPMPPTEAGHDLRCLLETSFAATQGLREVWDNAVIRFGGSIYMSYDWVRTWWEFYGAGKELRMFTFTCGEELVGIVPLYIDSLGFGPARFKVARLIGANIPPKVFDPPMDQAWAEVMFNRILVQLFDRDGCDLLSFGPVSELHKPTDKLPRACAALKDLVRPSQIVSDGVHSVFWLPATMGEYFQSLSRNERKNRKSDLKKLQTEHAGRVEVVRDPGQVEAEFENFRQQHAAQWAAEGRAGHFGAWPRATEFNRALVQAHSRLGRVRFVRILAGEKTIANLYAFAFGGCYYCELPARSIDPQWGRFSLGPAGIITTVEAAIQERKRRLEGGIGHYKYKVNLGAKEHQLLRVRVLANRLGSRLRLLAFSALRLGFLYGYHKIWYRRLAPRLPGSSKPRQWPLWLRLDF